MSSEPLTRDGPGQPAEPGDPLAGLSDPFERDDGYGEPGDFGEPDGALDELALDDDDFDELGGDPEWLADLMSRDSEPVLLVWPREEYEQVDQRWPEVLEPIGADSWDAYRRYYQSLITRWTARRLPPLLQVTGTADGFAEWLEEQDVDPLSIDYVAMAEAYGSYLADQTGGVELPPAETDPCWCGSGDRYTDCCLPLSRR
ncbi:MAG TPA: SEC-C domain-containing protein [Natronosporangium sp.]